ncbi:hypothetical protein EYZ11_002950 [Aspergillus tanneri]|uniref:Uncharacterized protein n=1 Tax=Aspergillus tanneri TaxID=1220188 RepID=A0A4S3JPS0_9EURO|nr:hypothetical protein EYZ11_002950 [Aspergillus tanneri]
MSASFWRRPYFSSYLCFFVTN